MRIYVHQGRLQDFSQGGEARFFRNKTFSGIRNKSKEKGSKLKKYGTQLTKLLVAASDVHIYKNNMIEF